MRDCVLTVVLVAFYILSFVSVHRQAGDSVWLLERFITSL